MLMRCAGMMAGPAGMAAGVVFATGMAAGLAVGAGAVGAALLARRMWEERQGWREGVPSEPPLPPLEPAEEAPSA